MSVLLTPERAKQAINLVEPAILKLLDDAARGDGILKRPTLYILVLDPSESWDVGTDIEDVVLASRAFNEGDGWTRPYDEIAQAKALVSWRTGKPSGWVREFAPHLYLPGDVKYRGSWVTDGIVTAASGVQSYFDEMFAKWLGAACSALAVHALQPILTDDRRDYIV